MVPLILETDSSRVVSIMIQDHGAVPKIEGVNGDHHNLSHHGQDEAKIAQLKKVESQIIGKLDGLLTQLRERGDDHGPLLDSTTVLFGSNLGNAELARAEAPADPGCRRRLQPRQASPPRGRPRRAAQQPLRDPAAGDGGRDGPVPPEQRHADLVVGWSDRSRGRRSGGSASLSSPTASRPRTAAGSSLFGAPTWLSWNPRKDRVFGAWVRLSRSGPRWSRCSGKR